jgi:hypothetical protein
MYVGLTDQVEGATAEPTAPQWLRRLVAVWMALVLGRGWADFGLRHAMAQMTWVPAEADANGGR